MRPKRRSPTATPAQYGYKFEAISFHSSDGVKLAGWFVPAAHRQSRGVIVLCHGIDAHRQQMLGNARILHEAGFATVLFDFRARGESGGNYCTLGDREVNDVQAAVRWIEARPDLRGVPIGVLGASLGAATAIMAAARTPEIRAIIAESPFSQLDSAVDCNFREQVGAVAPFLSMPTRWAGEMLVGRSARDISPLRAISLVAPRPILIIEDSNDTLFPKQETQALYRAARAGRQIWTVEGAGHVGASYVAPEEYHRRVVAFFGVNLGRAGHRPAVSTKSR
jgi:fermentation-respiration switch protein FrsA (DUF1100 family)